MTDDTYKPRLYQMNARDQVISGLETSNKTVFLVLLPTGMGKTFISTLTLEMLLERELVKPDEKILFLVQDRKLKYQLYDMAKKYGLADYGYLFLLEEQKALPAQMSRKHAAMAKFLFATPVLLMNAVTGRAPRIDRVTLDSVKVVIIDEILDIFAQSYGKTRPPEETIRYIETKFGQGRTFQRIVQDLKQELEASQPEGSKIDEKQIESHLIREFSARNYRLSKKFEPILHLLGLLNQESERIVVGMTAALSQDAKIDLLKTTFGGETRVAEIRPVGDDFEDYKPAYNLQRIRVFDDWITNIDGIISTIKRDLLKTLNKAYKILTGRPRIPYDRILLFITDILAKKGMQQKLQEKMGGDDQKITHFLASATAYLQMTVARQRLLESTFRSFYTFVNKITNKVLTSRPEFETIMDEVAKRTEAKLPDEKEKRLLYWLEKFAQEGMKVLVMCRFVDTTKHLTEVTQAANITSTNVHGGMAGSMQHDRIMSFKTGDIKVLFASERLIEKGTDLPEADVGIYYGTTLSLERYEQSLGRIRSTMRSVKTLYTISYNQTVEDEKSLKRDTMFMELIGKKLGSIVDTS
ncbi:MAG: helicase-related protein [Candidatus Thorarchaeota archaeon]